MVPLGLAGEATTTPLSGAARCRGEQSFAGHRPTRRCVGFDPDRLATERRQNVAIGRIAGQRHRHAIACFESSKECQDEACRGTGGDDNPGRIDVEPVPFAHRPTRCAGAATPCRGFRYSRGARRQRGTRRRDRGCRRARRGLADFHVDDPAPLRLEAGRRSHHVHHHEWRHGAASRRPQQVFGSLKHHRQHHWRLDAVVRLLRRSPRCCRIPRAFVRFGFPATRRPRVDRKRLHP